LWRAPKSHNVSMNNKLNILDHEGLPWRLSPSQAFQILPTALRHGMNRQLLNSCITAARQSYTIPSYSPLFQTDEELSCTPSASGISRLHPGLLHWIELADRLDFKPLLLDCLNEVKKRGVSSSSVDRPAALFRSALHSPSAHTMLKRLSSATSQQLILLLAGLPCGYKVVCN
jgi:hypothetical protein